MSTFHNSNLLYRVSLSIWQARKKDKSESTKVTEAAGAKAGAANVNKALLPDNPKLEAIRKWGDQLRDYVYTNTAPWDDGGWRIGRVVRHMEFMAKTGDMLRQGDELVADFLDNYQASVEEARFTLNELFDQADYPGIEELRTKFRFTVDVQTMPNVEDFRVVDGVPQDEVDKLIASAKASADERVKAAMNEAFERLFKVVQKFGTTLEQYGAGGVKKFNDSLVGNITELVEAMPALNIVGDPRLDALTARAKELTMYAAMDLRKLPEVREAAMKEAQAISAMFAGAEDRPVTAKAELGAPYGQEVEATKSPAPAKRTPRKPPAPPMARTTVTPEPVADTSYGMSLRQQFADML